MAGTRSVLHRPWAAEREMVILSGSFAPNGASAVDSTSNKGKGFTVARTSAGLFTVTISEAKYLDLVSATATLQLATADDKYIQVGTYTAPTSSAQGTIVLTVWDASGAAATDVAADANNRINFCFVFRKSSLTP